MNIKKRSDQSIELFWLALFSFLHVLTAFAEAPSLTNSIEIRGSINPATADYLDSAIKKAEKNKAKALIVKLDTPGGLLASVQKMSQSIDESKVPVVVFVTPAGASATSAGALLMLASHTAAMTPGSHMGAAHPVDLSGKAPDDKSAMGTKIVSDTVAFAQGLAERRGRDKVLAGEIVSKSRSFTAQEAFDKKLVQILAESEADLLKQLHSRYQTADSYLEKVEMSLGQKILHLLADPNIAAILMTLAFIFIYAELKNPGIQITGILGLICLVVAFMSFQTLPIRTGALVLMGVGLLSLVGEVFLATSGMLALGGVAAFTLGMIWVVDPTQSSVGVSMAVWLPAALSMGSGTVLIAYFASKVKKDSALALAAMKGGGVLGLQGYQGVVETPGKLMIRGEIWDFVSDTPVQVGDHVVVENVEGFKLKVKPEGKQ